MKQFFSMLVLSVAILITASPAYAQDEIKPDAFYRARVTKIVEEKQEDTLSIAQAAAFSQRLEIELVTGPNKGQMAEVAYGAFRENQKLKVGEQVVVIAQNGSDNKDQLYIFDRYRIQSLAIMAGIFFLLTIFLAGRRGATSLVGLAFSIAVLMGFIIPRILSGGNPLGVVLIGSVAIATVSIYIAHGFNRRTSVAVGGTLISICIAIGTSLLFVWMGKLFRFGSEETLYLQTAGIGNINLQGLLLGGIIIGALGVLDDITTAQAAAVAEIADANPALSPAELFRRGLSVGKEHITSLVNTLVLAYAGASFPALLLFVIYERPWWVVANTEVIAEEIVRTLVGSIALMCAVPITTAIAARVFGKNKR